MKVGLNERERNKGYLDLVASCICMNLIIFDFFLKFVPCSHFLNLDLTVTISVSVLERAHDKHN